MNRKGASRLPADLAQVLHVSLDVGLHGAAGGVFVLASHGMGPHYDGTFLLSRILRELLEVPVAPGGKRAMARAFESIWYRLQDSLRSRLRGMRGRLPSILTRSSSPVRRAPTLMTTATWT